MFTYYICIYFYGLASILIYCVRIYFRGSRPCSDLQIFYRFISAFTYYTCIFIYFYRIRVAFMFISDLLCLHTIYTDWHRWLDVVLLHLHILYRLASMLSYYTHIHLLKIHARFLFMFISDLSHFKVCIPFLQSRIDDSILLYCIFIYFTDSHTFT